MIDYVIIDDEPAAIEVLEIHLNTLPSMVQKASFRDPMEALDYLQQHKVDLIFLDINMPKLSGISFSRLLQNPPLIIFTTAYSEYALESYELKAVDYLLKPIQFDRLLQAIMKVKNVLNQTIGAQSANAEPSADVSEQTIFIKSGAEFHQLAIKNIKYIESDGNYVTFHTAGRPILARYKLSEVLGLLPPHQFVRVHRSFVVALKHIETIKNHCVIIDKHEVPLSSTYREDFLEIINGKIGE
ncbi:MULTISPECIES: LytTR family DNA-binding domain-containing protein [unclassified Imperialibacter]|uniref:LytR/AlgR family response regulator transcription factor n=1 Tax=unclassified Imperialibacter TaxID=2629706 RepID=UPI001258C0CB|nr:MULTISPECIES: LytTR family DNA-binding domain-containing protein [unclassified Imperialibacter]CAD5254172.1 DNA-binding response regulator [Imperialibacter sp. 75]CAD5262607.1 DNA-binding response regulator [Imperialibacter sp. 89]VVT35284.1 Two component transcriptional regulator, LytTR family [Imperialibacter sp. EC-SDR9]